MTETPHAEPAGSVDKFLSWVIESWLDIQPVETQMAFAWGVENRKRIAEAKVASGVADVTDLGAIALAQTFLDEFRSTLTG